MFFLNLHKYFYKCILFNQLSPTQATNFAKNPHIKLVLNACA